LISAIAAFSPPPNCYSANLARQQFQQYNETDKEKEAPDNPCWGCDPIRVADPISQNKPKRQSDCTAHNAGDTRQEVKQHFQSPPQKD
jgi:hypothetical protein